MHVGPEFLRDSLTERSRTACRSEPLLASMGPDHLVEIPQRVLRQPHRRADLPTPPLIRMLATGRGAAEARLRTYLWTWAALSTRSYSNVDLRKPALEWAALANVLPDDDLELEAHPRHGARDAQVRAATRRVSRAIEYLQSERLVRWSKPDLIWLLEPDGTGRAYEPWSTAILDGRDKDREDLARFYGYRTDYRRSWVWEDPPLAIPAAVWTNGIISALPAASLVVLLILWDYESEPGAPILVPKSRAYEYPVKHSTWNNGLADLEAKGLIERSRGPLVFSASNANPKVTSDRYRARWQIKHAALGFVA